VPTGSQESLPVAVINGRRPGPHVWLSGAIHGDELNGVEIVRKVMRLLDAKTLRGAVIAVPIVNPLGFIIESRYLPDRRDLNRAFPGSPRGSTASRLAHLFMREVVSQCSLGIDLHTASNHRVNIPQIRADTHDAATLRLARTFGAPFIIHARARDGSLRQAATELGATVLVYEAGEAHRFDQDAIEAGVVGVMRSFRSLRMVDIRLPRVGTTRVMRRTRWVRARRGGLANITVELGDEVKKGQVVRPSLTPSRPGRRRRRLYRVVMSWPAPFAHWSTQVMPWSTSHPNRGPMSTSLRSEGDEGEPGPGAVAAPDQRLFGRDGEGKRWPIRGHLRVGLGQSPPPF
jgi:predicted deacylase